MQRTRNISAALIVAAIGIAATQTPWPARAAGTTQPTTFHPITPCRILDTRAGADQIGDRTGALGAGDVHVQQFGGTHGDCELPEAVELQGVALNVTVAGPTAQSNLRVYPATADLPVTANINWPAGSPPIGNKVDVSLADGAAAFRNAFGHAHVIVDVLGYYSTTDIDRINSRLARLENGAPTGGSTGPSIASHERTANFFLDGEPPERAAWIDQLTFAESGSLLLSATGSVRSASTGTGLQCWFEASDRMMKEPRPATWVATASDEVDQLHGQRVLPVEAGATLDVSWTCERTGDGAFSRLDDIVLTAMFVPATS